jgi:hypothetical protein
MQHCYAGAIHIQASSHHGQVFIIHIPPYSLQDTSPPSGGSDTTASAISTTSGRLSTFSRGGYNHVMKHISFQLIPQKHLKDDNPLKRKKANGTAMNLDCCSLISCHEAKRQSKDSSVALKK